MKITAVTSPENDILKALNGLLPQLSANAKPLSRDAFVQIIASGCCTLFVASHNEVIIGCLTLVLYRIPSRLHAWIEDVVVAETARGQGVGEALVRHAMAQAQAQGAGRIGLSSSPERTAANRLYQKIGFKERHTNVYQFTFDRDPR